MNSDRPEGVPRREVRFATFDFVEICDENGERLSAATIRELSKTGARLRLRSSKILPKRLLLSWPERQLSRLATLVWIDGPSIGIEFDNGFEFTDT